MTADQSSSHSQKIAVKSTNYPSISRLTITGFRSYERLVLNLDARPVILTGPNGSGKTNILEAISCLGPGRGLRSAPKVDLARIVHGCLSETWGVHAVLETGTDRTEIATGLGGGKSGGRQITQINGRASTATEAAQTIRLVWLTPAMDRLFIEGAGNRRRFYDRLVLAFDPGHGTRVNAYEKAMRERMRLLRDETYDRGWVAALETRMAENGLAIAASRQALLTALMASIQKGQSDLSRFPAAELNLTCEVQSWLEQMSALDCEERFSEALADNRAMDAGAGRALRGVHRADLLVRHARKQIGAAQCSTGEQKALLISILLAHARLQKQEGPGRTPILLLDEITAHLDEARRHQLFDAINDLGVQAWMTGTEQSIFDEWGTRAQYISVPDLAGL